MADGEQGSQIRVFLLDDHEVVRRGVRDLLDDDPDIISAVRTVPSGQCLLPGREDGAEPHLPPPGQARHGKP
ncbi:hypothetical protein ACQPXS_43760 [Streptomyces sp. CA-142005]|uniref:hypothetical protein n=1 Tax=Streptomyces sp. CA-142005 TaxID=3240052 RepID=UPI003D8A1CC8